MYYLKTSLVLILGYLLFFTIFQFLNLPLEWYQQNLLAAFILFLASFWFIRGKTLVKIAITLISLFIAFILSFIYSNLAVWHASNLCSSYVKQQMLNEGIENTVEPNGLPTIVNLTDQCANDYLPFPWFSKPKTQ